MSSFLFLTCCFLIIIACSEGAVTDAKERVNASALIDFIHKFHKKHGIMTLESRQINSNCNVTLPTGCNLLDFAFSAPSTVPNPTDSYLNSINQRHSRICTSTCVGAVVKAYRCIYSGGRLDYLSNLVQKYLCGQHNGDYCPVSLIRSIRDRPLNALALANIQASCTISFATTGITCGSSTSSRCTNAISTFSGYTGCCTEPLLGSGVRSCSGVSVPEACTGISGATVESSATGIMATAPIVAVSLMVFALVGVLL